MKFSDRIKTYNFWVSIASAVFLIINLIGKKFNFTIDESAYNDMFTAFCSILVLLGIIVPPTNSRANLDYQNSDYYCEYNEENVDKTNDNSKKNDDNQKDEKEKNK